MDASPKVQAWKPSPRFAAMFDSPPPAEVPAPVAYKAWGFGSRVASRAYSPPAPPEMPKDWWKQDRSFVARSAS